MYWLFIDIIDIENLTTQHIITKNEITCDNMSWSTNFY